MIDLAPHHKIGLPLSSPLIAGGGAFGFANEYSPLVDFARFGAFITNPLTLRPRQPAAAQAVIPFPGGVLVHTGLPNPGLPAAIRSYERAWSRLGTQIVVHVAATGLDEVSGCVDLLERVELVAGIELGFREDESVEEAEAIMRAAVQRARQPIIVQLPRPRAPAFARAAERAGAQAVTVSAPPRGSMWDARLNSWIEGRLYGPALLPQTLNLIREIKKQTARPIIGAGGVHSPADAEAMLAAGAVAALVDSAVWVRPDL